MAWWAWASRTHFRVNHGENELARGSRHINGIESFWSYAKRRLARFNGIPKKTFHLHLKECGFHFNHYNEAPYRLSSTCYNPIRSDPVCFLRPKNVSQ